MIKRSAIGQQGSWFAKVGDESLPCVQECWVNRSANGGGMRYEEPHYFNDEKQWQAYVQALRDKQKVILTRGKLHDSSSTRSGIVFERTGYIAVFRIDKIETEGTFLRFDFSERLQDLK
jgi:hypothetical protein